MPNLLYHICILDSDSEKEDKIDVEIEDKADALWKPRSKEHFKKEPTRKRKKRSPEWKPIVCDMCKDEDMWYNTKDVRKTQSC